MKPGLNSYKEMELAILEILAGLDEAVYARYLGDIILKNYKTNKLKVRPRSIAKRLQDNPEIGTIKTRDGLKYFLLK